MRPTPLLVLSLSVTGEPRLTAGSFGLPRKGLLAEVVLVSGADPCVLSYLDLRVFLWVMSVVEETKSLSTSDASNPAPTLAETEPKVNTPQLTCHLCSLSPSRCPHLTC